MKKKAGGGGTRRKSPALRHVRGAVHMRGPRRRATQSERQILQGACLACGEAWAVTSDTSCRLSPSVHAARRIGRLRMLIKTSHSPARLHTGTASAATQPFIQCTSQWAAGFAAPAAGWRPRSGGSQRSRGWRTGRWGVRPSGRGAAACQCACPYPVGSEAARHVRGRDVEAGPRHGAAGVLGGRY